MKKILAAIVLLFSLTFGVVITPASTANAGFSGIGGCQHTFYYNPSRVFYTCSAGTLHNQFQAYIRCNNTGPYNYGPWQSNPGPWYGSTATCATGSTITQNGVRWSN